MITGTLAYIDFDFRVIFRERVSLFMILVLPAAMYAFFGVLFGETTYGPEKNSYYSEYTASFTGLILLNIALMNVGPALAIYKEQGLFRRLLVTPLDMSSIWLASIIRSLVIFLIGYVEMLGVGYLMFGKLPSSTPLQLFLAITVCAYALFSLGFAIGSTLKSSQAVFNAGMVLFQPMLLLSGASLPLDVFPVWVRFLAQVLPMTHVVELLRLAWRKELFTSSSVAPAVLLLVFGTLCAVIARRALPWSLK